MLPLTNVSTNVLYIYTCITKINSAVHSFSSLGTLSKGHFASLQVDWLIDVGDSSRRGAMLCRQETVSDLQPCRASVRRSTEQGRAGPRSLSGLRHCWAFSRCLQRHAQPSTLLPRPSTATQTVVSVIIIIIISSSSSRQLGLRTTVRA